MVNGMNNDEKYVLRVSEENENGMSDESEE
jgi:hypothetical protein